MRLPLRLALRYLVKRRSSTMVHLISGISVLVIAAVTTAMVCILSAFNGIEDLVKTLFGTLDADLAVVPVTGQVLPESWGAHLDSLEGVAAWTAVLEDECVARDGETVRVASLLGVRADYPSVAPIDQAVVEGEYMVGGNTLGVSCACLGLGVRSELGISSDELEPPVFSLSAPIRGRRLSTYRERAFRTIPMHACGTFSINADLDTRYLMVPLKDAQSLLAREGEVSRFEVKAAPGWSQDDLARHLESHLRTQLSDVEAGTFRVRTRDEKHKFITQTNQAEKWATFAILSFILVVAAFNIMASLTMLLLDKKEDLQVLRAMGLPQAQMESTFALQGLAINVIGGLAGVALGSLL
ncbi:MAG: FtsX-like permease family protein, partial [Flavobacteriales bacterium]